MLVLSRPMADDKPLSDNQVHDRFHAALLLLGNSPGVTKHGDTALKSARHALLLLQMGVVAASEAANDDRPKDPAGT
jgi:hypothetical protein